jgi:hypothetical protein
VKPQEQTMPNGQHVRTKDGIPTRHEKLKLEVIDALVEGLQSKKLSHGRVAYFNHDVIEKVSKLAGEDHEKIVKLVAERIY